MYQDRIQQLDKLPRDRRRRLDLFYREAAGRHNGAWRGKGYSGEDYREPGHPYQFDLNILGEGSLFEYLATARTEAGRQALATHLLHPVSADEARARQAAVRELSALPDLREAVATLGETTYSDCNADAANAWLTMDPANFPSWLAPLALLTSSALALLLIVSLLALVPWKVAVPYLAGLLIWHGLLAYVHQSQVRLLLKAGFELEPEIAILHDGLSLLARQSFTAPKLQQLQRRAAALPADLRRLRRLTHWARERENEYFYAPSMYLFIGTQLAIRLERWRTTHGAHLQEAIAIWSEFEALEALGTYAFEHPGDIYPEFCEQTAFSAEGLGHPLLDPAACVRNDARFDADQRFWIISGSNMAGKSTLLRSIGISVVLAHAGAPVRAARLTLAPLQVFASIAIPDSLLDGTSRFKAEVDRVRDAIAGAAQAPSLFLIDELFSGTNSLDRRVAAEAVVRTLIGHGAIGALSTHDLALTEIAQDSTLHGANVHMCSRSDDQVLDFDYRVKPGVNRQSNALAIARLAGVPV